MTLLLNFSPFEISYAVLLLQPLVPPYPSLTLSAPPFPTHSPYVSPRLPQMAPSYPPAFVLYRLVSTGHFTPVSRNPLVVATARENHVRLGRRNTTSVMPRGGNFRHWGRSGQVRSQSLSNHVRNFCFEDRPGQKDSSEIFVVWHIAN